MNKKPTGRKSTRRVKTSLLEAAKNLEPRRQCWTDGVDDALMKELRELRAAYKRGKLKHVSATALFRLAREHGVKVGGTTFRDWLNSEV